MVITTAMAHGGRTVGANLELQAQHLALGLVTSSYILVIQGIVVGLGRTSAIDFDVAARITHAVALAVFCFFVASAYTYTPRLVIPIKINATAVYWAFTVYPAQRNFDVRPLPGYLLAQLLGAAISTLVNIFVLPSTNGRNLLARLRNHLAVMTECCTYFEGSVGDLGKRDRQQRSMDALRMRAALHRAGERLGQAVGGARYETMIDRFSQIDYHHIFQATSELSSSFSSMCLPLGIDRHFYYHLQDPSAKMTFGSMASIYNASPDTAAVAARRTINSGSNSKESLDSCVSEDLLRSKPANASTMYKSRHHHASSTDLQKTLRELTEHHMRMDIRSRSAEQALEPIKKQIALHRKILRLLFERSEEMERRSATKSLFHLAARTLKSIYGPAHRRVARGFGIEEAIPSEEDLDAFVDQYVATEDEQAKADLDMKMSQMDLDQLAYVVDKHAYEFEQEETKYIGMIAPYNPQDDQPTHEKNVLLLSFIGILRENAICMSKLLRTLYKVNMRRPNYMQLWLPRLSWSWLHSRRSAEEDNNDDEVPDEDWELEHAFEEEPEEPLDEYASSESESNDESGSENGINDEPSSTGAAEYDEGDENSLRIHIHRTISRATTTSSQQSRRRAAQFQQQLQQEQIDTTALYTMVDNRYARVARAVLDWSRRAKTRYAVKFTVTMMVWAVWAYIKPFHAFFVTNNGSWGLTSISTVFGVTIGSTINAGVSRLLAVSLSGSWAIVTWKASRQGHSPYPSYVCLVVYFVVALYIGFFVRRWTAVGPVMVISLVSVLFSAYNVPSERDATALGWKHVVVNIIAILFATAVSTVFMPHRARTALRTRVADVLRLNSLAVQGINHMHVARADFSGAYRNERRRVRDFVNRSRVQIAKCRALIPAAEREPGVHEKFQADAHRRLIDTLELQLEWMLYSFFTHTNRNGSLVLRSLIRRVLPMREDIVGAKSAFNSMLASALSTRARLPAYLPDIATARDRFVQSMRPLLTPEYTSSFEITFLARWDVGIWHLIATQAALCRTVRAIVGAETDRWPETVGFMLDTLETTQARAGNTIHDRWFSRLPKYYDTAGSTL
ncbi:hypothetical protein IW140_002124 [Coemansia sp. RSA 1813]|nr:hypothetical protein EV178_001273 [Coemansia sp. RSA 1646]KAJ1772624.1 hypothetical protein LPJ74_001340 [Coemansia sp. RSA 1843]KAJ2090236.1 hypothetical protein IW138_002868 [Coemansia sp. RSA 986]KAJ2214640.1 hypothetical protein EV179_002899 [Coemansia sp. RSA 487]KAJ2570698.1 hypothetical protein IW140_002124 [Coemansia sp. RSA 1813]